MRLYQRTLIATLRDGLAWFSARSARRSDAVHRELCATLPESRPASSPATILSAGPPIDRPPSGSRMRPVGGRRNVLTMHRIDCDDSPTRRAAYAISKGHYQGPWVFIWRNYALLHPEAEGAVAVGHSGRHPSGASAQQSSERNRARSATRA